jgi:hypothetical protein
MITASFFIILLFKLGKYYPKESDFQLQDVIGDDVDQKLVVKVASLILAGSIMLVVSWSLVQFASFFYKYRPQPTLQTRKLWSVIAECWRNHTILVGNVSESVRLASIIAMLYFQL